MGPPACFENASAETLNRGMASESTDRQRLAFIKHTEGISERSIRMSCRGDLQNEDPMHSIRMGT